MTTVNFKAIAANGSPIEGAVIDVTLIESGVAYLGEGIVLPTSLKGVTDANGDFSTELEPIDTAPYVLVCYDPVTNRKAVYDFYVPESEDPVNVADIVLYPPPSGVNYDAAAMRSIVNNRVLAQQAAVDAAAVNMPRFVPSTLVLVDDEFTLTSAENNGFLTVPDDEGTIIIPLDDTVNFPIGSAFVFVRDSASETAIADISFAGELEGITLNSLSGNEVKLQYKKDIITLVKEGVNTWRIFNTSEGALENIEYSLVNTDAAIGDLDVAVATLNGWREAFNTQLVSLVSGVNSQSLSIASINSTIATINELLISIDETIQARVDAVMPQASEISYDSLISGFNVSNMQDAIDILATSFVAGETATNVSKTASFTWAIEHHNKTVEINSASNITVTIPSSIGLYQLPSYTKTKFINVGTGNVTFVTQGGDELIHFENGSFILKGKGSVGILSATVVAGKFFGDNNVMNHQRNFIADITALKALDVNRYVHAHSSISRYYYDSVSVTAPDDVTVFKPDSVTLPNAGRWFRVQIVSEDIADDSILNQHILDGEITNEKLAGDITEDKLFGEIPGSKLLAAVANEGLSQNIDGNLDVLVDDVTLEINIDNELQVKSSYTPIIPDDSIAISKLVQPTAGTTYTIKRLVGSAGITITDEASYSSTTGDYTMGLGTKSPDGYYDTVGFTCLMDGEVTISLSHLATNDTAYWRTVRNGVQVTEYTTNTSDGNKSYNETLSISLGDSILIQHRSGNDPAESSTISNVRVRSGTKVAAVA